MCFGQKEARKKTGDNEEEFKSKSISPVVALSIGGKGQSNVVFVHLWDQRHSVSSVNPNKRHEKKIFWKNYQLKA